MGIKDGQTGMEFIAGKLIEQGEACCEETGEGACMAPDCVLLNILEAYYEAGWKIEEDVHGNDVRLRDLVDVYLKWYDDGEQGITEPNDDRFRRWLGLEA